MLGTYLNIKHAELKRIESQYGRDIERCKLEMVHHWKQNDPTANWRKLRQALHKRHYADVAQSPKTSDANADDDTYYTFEPLPAEESGLCSILYMREPKYVAKLYRCKLIL